MGRGGGAHYRRMEATRPFRQTHGGQWCGQGGRRSWAGYGPNWVMGPKQSFLTLTRSTFSIKSLRSLEQWISGKIVPKTAAPTQQR
jgi:hypothetical protein